MKLSQRTRILQGLKSREWLSLADALSANPPIYRLSERIRELEKLGYIIEHRRAEGKPYEEYHLTSEPSKPRIVIENGKAVMYMT